MKRSRACEDLRALEASPPSQYSNSISITGQQSTPHQRGLKRSKRQSEMVIDGDCGIEELHNDDLLAALCVNSPDSVDAFQFVLGMQQNFERRHSSGASASTASSSFDEVLPPIRRNSRDMMIECDVAMQFTKKMQLMDPIEKLQVPFSMLCVNSNR
ncbi:uncharacterized protein PHALS_04716 [Globisporangium polare]